MQQELKIEDLGWDEFFETKRAELGLENFAVARVIAEHKGAYKIILNTDETKFGGFNLIDETITHLTSKAPKDPSGKEWLKLYIPVRTALVLKKQ